MDHYFPVAMDKIESFLADPIQVCKIFFVCRSKTTFLEAIQHKTTLEKVFPNRHQHLRNVIYALPTLKTKSGTNACTACKSTLTAIIALLKLNITGEGLTKGLTILVCTKIMPGSITPSCNDFMGLYLDAVIEMTLNELIKVGPDQICKDLKACNATSSLDSSLSVMNLNDPSSAACDACQLVSVFLVDEFKDPGFQQDVLSFVKNLVCAKEKSTEAQCSSMVDQYIPYIMQVICDFLSRKTFCHFLHMCPAN
jgi:hypothetical protein